MAIRDYMSNHPINKLWREAWLPMMHLSNPRFIRRMGNQFRRTEAKIASAGERLSAIDIEKSKELISRYNETLNDLRILEARLQLHPETVSADAREEIKALRLFLNENALFVSERKEDIERIEREKNEIHALSKRARLQRRRYTLLVFRWNIFLTFLASLLAKGVMDSGIVPKFVVYVASGGAAARGLGVVVALTFGGCLYWLRKRWRRLYAALELGFALMAAWASLGDVKLLDDTAKQVSFIGAIYLIVRAFDNFAQGQSASAEVHKRRLKMVASRLANAGIGGIHKHARADP